MILAIILGVLLLFSLLANFQQVVQGMAGGGSRSGGRWLEEVVVENHRSRNKIALVDVSGLIMGNAYGGGMSMVDYIEDQLSLAGKDKSVQGVVLRIDSPGGEVLASDDISRAIAEFQDKHGKPVVASMGSLAASGGYYVAAPCQWIVANELTITGSIGVIMQGYNYRGLMDKVGVQPLVFKSGKFKDMLSATKPESEITPEERKMVQDLVDETFSRFKQVVRNGRTASNRSNNGEGRRLVNDWEEYADGRILSGKVAFDYGFVDELGTFETAFDRVLRLSGTGEANLIQYRQPFHFGNLFRLFGKAESSSVKIDLGLDLPRLQAGRMYFLSPTFLH